MLLNKNCLIVSGGDFSENLPENVSFDYVIACDRGYEYAHRLGLIPNVIIGDFDSSEKPKTEIKIIEHPVMKDDTDTMLAIRHAINSGFGNIYLSCALGGRFDHAFANIQSLAFAVNEGADAYIYSDNTVIYAFSSKEIKLKKHDGWSLSCFALTDKCEGVTIKGTKFECEDETVFSSFPIGVSNVWKDDNAIIKCDKGTLMIIESRLKSDEHI